MTNVENVENLQEENLLDVTRRRTPMERAYIEVMQYLERNNRTLQEELELINQKKSNLSRRLRDFVQLMVEIEKYNAEQVSEKTFSNEAKESQ